MQPAGEFRAERRVDQAVGFDPILTAKGFRHDPHTEMRLAFGPRPGMALVPVGLVDYLKLGRGKSLG